MLQVRAIKSTTIKLTSAGNVHGYECPFCKKTWWPNDSTADSWWHLCEEMGGWKVWMMNGFAIAGIGEYLRDSKSQIKAKSDKMPPPPFEGDGL